MKKILIIIICVLMIVGCKKKNNTNDDIDNSPKKVEIVYYTEEDAKERLKEIAEDVYQSKKYESFSMKDGVYYISLKELRDTLKYNTDKVDYIDGLKCDENRTGVGIDVNHVENKEYYGSPIVLHMLCNPPKTEE